MGGRGGGSGMGVEMDRDKGLLSKWGAADTPSGLTIDDFRNLNDDDMARFMEEVRTASMGDDYPDFLNPDSFYQRFSYALGMNSTPEVVDSKTMQQLINAGATPLYRTVSDYVYDWTAKNASGAYWADTISSEDQLDMIAYGDTTFHGKGMLGDGLYFSNDYGGSRDYGYITDAPKLGVRGGRTGQNIKTMTAIINPKTVRAISRDDLKLEYDKYMSNRRFRVRKAFKDSASVNNRRKNSYAQFAALMGYNVITEYVGGGETYYNVIDRSALIVSDKYR